MRSKIIAYQQTYNGHMYYLGEAFPTDPIVQRWTLDPTIILRDPKGGVIEYGNVIPQKDKRPI